MKILIFNSTFSKKDLKQLRLFTYLLHLRIKTYCIYIDIYHTLFHLMLILNYQACDFHMDEQIISHNVQSKTYLFTYL